MGAVEEVAQASNAFMRIMQKEPLSLALVVMNLCLLLFFYVLLTAVAAQREREIGLLYADKKEVREMLAKCVVPNRTNLSTWQLLTLPPTTPSQ